MSLEITGKLIQKLPVQTGEGKNGPWSKGGFVLETSGDRFPKKVCCVTWGDTISQVNAFNEGANLKASIDVESREYNGRWYTDVRAWRIEALPDGGGSVDPQPNYNTSQEPREQYNPSQESADDDLPF
ncbi:DUF3127 domain-containing protein [Compostibacter hankyongensis]|uniref:DUF3127 domain-containing protein n=1 Tax=Compostibacter hankyongensis TaxID=1007089 RepID=A0ABP8G9G6_9BACT